MGAGLKWVKLGYVYCADNNHRWMRTHAANPVAELLHGDLCRVYFSSRDAANRSSIAFVEIDLTGPQRILRVSDRPVLGPGKAGAFDDSGASMGCLVTVGAKRYLYYLGWNLGVTVPWRNSIGLATSDGPDGEFVRVSEAPVLDRGHVDPYSVSYPWVMREQGAWKMWYGSNLSWGPKQSDMAHVIKYAESTDGTGWQRRGVIAVDFKAKEEFALSKPCVVRHGSLYRMWYSYRGAQYRIGYAESADGMQWTRMDHKAGIGVSANGWDSESIEYAHVFRHRGRWYMLYNGNRYGKTGFGLAAADDEQEGAA